MPPKNRIYLLSLPENKAIEEYIEEALATGYIHPSTSPAAAGFFFVGKKDCGLRPCIDYRGLNTITPTEPSSLTYRPTNPPRLDIDGSLAYQVRALLNCRRIGNSLQYLRP
ncbi:hypothetical protein QTP70_033437 [Hemibagrus guttatus]|uniref:Uncharacterized protein n=1 Tax=Hemibagrus guttatus TaxID=175788 RepID=A0AAE0RHS5_9TELE|nr:hypothetical protein QTP70_033437 [Hemibagrus guttatus]